MSASNEQATDGKNGKGTNGNVQGDEDFRSNIVLFE